MSAEDREGRTPLSFTAASGHDNVFKLLLALKQVDLNAKNKDGQISLLWAVKNEHEAIIKLLLKRELDINSLPNEHRCHFLPKK